ncbi:TPA: serine O-acetyltransferase [Streptococcus suis]
MLKALKATYCRLVGKKRLLLLRALKTYYVSPIFRVNVLIEKLNMTSFGRNHIRKKLTIKYGVEIAKNARIGNDLIIEHFNGLTIGEGVIIGNNCRLYHQVTIGQKNGKYPTIGNNVIIYPGAKIFGDIKVGNNVIIGANSVINFDVPDNTVVAGNPAKILKTRRG